jgi:molecular chaperone HscB
MVQCPSCARRFPPCLVCPDCGSPIAAELDCFAALGLARRLVIDPAAIERAYHELGRKLHPDRFASAPQSVRDASLRATALLTRSYRTLRDPVSRGLYWLELNGEKLAENNQRVPTEIAELVFDVQEQLAQLDSVEGAGEQGLVGAIGVRRIELQASIEQADRELAANFARWDERGQNQTDSATLVDELKTILSRTAYMRTLMRDIDRGLERARAG